MAGSITVSSITLDSDNNFSIKSNTGATLFFANTSGVDIANSIGATAITNDKILSVANTKITGNIISTQIASVNGSVITANTIANSAIQTGAVENYLNAGGRPLSNRNLIFNGAMQIAQRNTSVTTITTNDAVLTADRWKVTSGSLGTWTMNVESNGPTSTGLRKSSNLICTTANTSPPASSYLIFKQDMEGQMMQSIKKGTPGAEQVTVSFWVKSSNTGTFIAEMVDDDNSRSCSQTFTINTANTWEKETITFPADTTGQLDNDNARSMELNFWFGAGSTFTGGTLQTSWGAYTDNKRAVGQLNLANRVGNYIAFTGVQWEIGPVATPFEFEDIGTTLRKCQRYYEKSFAQETAPHLNESYNFTTGTIYVGTSISVPIIPFKVTKRAAPTMTFWGVSSSGWRYYAGGFANLSATTGTAQDSYFYSESSGTSGLTQYQSTIIGGNWTAEIEL
jgi:hypothetical protein